MLVSFKYQCLLFTFTLPYRKQKRNQNFLWFAVHWYQGHDLFAPIQTLNTPSLAVLQAKLTCLTEQPVVPLRTMKLLFAELVVSSHVKFVSNARNFIKE